ncbi:hypothetical protein P7M41_25655, partial [Vibrio parahaemolyticus]|nr:hypothetical protein [Vibrio parahaemolyticus]
MEKSHRLFDEGTRAALTPNFHILRAVDLERLTARTLAYWMRLWNNKGHTWKLRNSSIKSTIPSQNSCKFTPGASC